MQSNDKKNFMWNTIGTTIFSFNSLFLMIAVTRINGVDSAGVFSFAFSFACIMNVIALYSGRTYQVTDHSGLSDNTFIITRLITSLLAIFFAIIFIIINGYFFDKALVIFMLCLLKCVEAISDVFYGIIQKNNSLHIVGKSMTYKSLVGIFIFLIVNFASKNMLLSCISILLVNIVFLFFYDMPHSKNVSLKISFKKKNILDLLKKSSYTFLFTLIVLIIVNIPKYAIDYKLGNVEQAIYGIISMPATFMMLLGQFILQPVLVKLSNLFKVRDKNTFNKIVLKLSLSILAILIIILPIAYLIGIPVLEIIYKLELQQYNIMLILVLIGAAFYAISNVLLNALITLRCTKEQFVLQVVTLLISVVISLSFTSMWGLDGSIVSYATILFIQFILYVILYLIEVNKRFKLEEEYKG